MRRYCENGSTSEVEEVRRTKAERTRIAADSMMPGVIVADIARKHGTTRWQIYDWRKQKRKGNPVVPESAAALPMFAEPVAEPVAEDRSTSCSSQIRSKINSEG